MEPLTASLTFSTIVGLIGQFRSERGSYAQGDFQEFLIWLTKSQHDQVRSQLEDNIQALSAVQKILDERHDALIERLDSFDSLLVAMASAFSGFRDLGLAIRPGSSLSKQAISIIRQFELSGASKVLEMKGMSGTNLMYLDAKGEIEIDDWRFFEDDVWALVELGLLRYDVNGKSQKIYIFTREASTLAQRFNL